MNLSQTDYFIAIARTGSLSAAAAQLGVSQPALSKYLSGLASLFGMPLFTREKRRLKLTQAGRIYYNASCRISSAMQETRSMIKALSITDKKELSIAVSPHQGAQVMAQMYPQIKKQFPGITLRLFEGYTRRLYQAVRSKKADLALTTVMEDEENVNVIPMFEEDMLLAVPSYHNLAVLSSPDSDHLAVIDVRELSDTPFVLMDEKNTTIGALSRRILEEAGIDPIVVYESENGFLVDAMIHAGAGVGFVPKHYVVPSRDVVYFALKKNYRFVYCVVTREGYHLSREERYLIYLQLKGKEHNPELHDIHSEELEKLAEEFEQDPSWPPLTEWRLNY